MVITSVTRVKLQECWPVLIARSDIVIERCGVNIHGIHTSESLKIMCCLLGLAVSYDLLLGNPAVDVEEELHPLSHGYVSTCQPS